MDLIDMFAKIATLKIVPANEDCYDADKRNPSHCPNCGAPIIPHKDKCEYCDTYYQY